MTPRERLQLMHLLRGAITDTDICACYGFDRVEYSFRSSGLLVTAWRGDRSAMHYLTVLAAATAQDLVEMRLNFLDALNSALMALETASPPQK